MRSTQEWLERVLLAIPDEKVPHWFAQLKADQYQQYFDANFMVTVDDDTLSAMEVARLSRRQWHNELSHLWTRWDYLAAASALGIIAIIVGLIAGFAAMPSNSALSLADNLILILNTVVGLTLLTTLTISILIWRRYSLLGALANLLLGAFLCGATVYAFSHVDHAFEINMSWWLIPAALLLIFAALSVVSNVKRKVAKEAEIRARMSQDYNATWLSTLDFWLRTRYHLSAREARQVVSKVRTDLASKPRSMAEVEFGLASDYARNEVDSKPTWAVRKPLLLAIGYFAIGAVILGDLIARLFGLEPRGSLVFLVLIGLCAVIFLRLAWIHALEARQTLKRSVP